MTHISQLRINKLNLNQFDGLKELCAHQTKLISGGGGDVYRFEGKKGTVEVRKEISDGDALKIGVEVAKWSAGEINIYDVRRNVDEIVDLPRGRNVSLITVSSNRR